MDAQDIIELIEYFRNLQDNEMKFEIEELRGYIDIKFEELYDKLTGVTNFNWGHYFWGLIWGQF